MSYDGVLRISVESVPATSPGWIETLSGLLVPLIAMIGVYIAFQQYGINRQRLRHETYERRLAIYKIVQRYLSEIVRDGKVSSDQALKFYSEASEAAFLFDASVMARIQLIYDKSIEMIFEYEKLYPHDGSPGLPVGEERSAVAQKKSELMGWHARELTECRKFFAEKLGLKVS